MYWRYFLFYCMLLKRKFSCKNRYQETIKKKEKVQCQFQVKKRNSIKIKRCHSVRSLIVNVHNSTSMHRNRTFDSCLYIENFGYTFGDIFCQCRSKNIQFLMDNDPCAIFLVLQGGWRVIVWSLVWSCVRRLLQALFGFALKLSNASVETIEDGSISGGCVLSSILSRGHVVTTSFVVNCVICN